MKITIINTFRLLSAKMQERNVECCELVSIFGFCSLPPNPLSVSAHVVISSKNVKLTGQTVARPI